MGNHTLLYALKDSYTVMKRVTRDMLSMYYFITPSNIFYIYRSKLMDQIELLKRKPAFPIAKAPTSLKQTTFSSLSLRLNEPYWLIHKGNCEHFMVIDQIRYVALLYNLLILKV